MKEKNFHAEAQGGGGWEIRRAKYIWRESSNLSQTGQEPLLSVSQYEGVRPATETSRSESLKGYKIVGKGDLVINIMLAWMGGLGVSKYDGIVSPAYAVYKPITTINQNFLHYLYRSRLYLAEFARHSTGVVPSRWRMYSDDFGQIYTALPPLLEQEAIVRYLDAETAKIDKAIAAEEKMIALLQERREIIINDAVGGGDFSHAEGRRGGGWEVRRLKSLLMRPLQYGANEAAEDNDYSQPRYIRITDIDDNGKLREETFRSMSMEKAKPYLLEKGDLLFARSGATAGKSFLFQEDYPACFAGYLIRVSLAASIAPKYLFYFTQSGKYRQWKEAVFIQATIQNISAEKYGNLPIPLPPLPEQERIVKYLDAETGKIDRAIEVKRRQIALLRERREIVINEVVTRKVKVA